MDQFVDKKQIEYYNSTRPKYTEELFSEILKHSTNNKTYLDVACGTGQLLIPLCKNFEISVGLDVSQEQVETCKTNLSKLENFNNFKNVHVYTSDVYEIMQKLQQENIFTTSENIFDLITIGQAFHWFDEVKFLSFMKTILKEKGTLILAGYTKQHFKSETQPELYIPFQKVIDKLIPYFECDMKNNDEAYVKSYENIQKIFGENFEVKKYEEKIDVNLKQVFDLLKSWSGYVNYKKSKEELEEDIIEQLKKTYMEFYKIDNEDQIEKVKVEYYSFYFTVIIKNKN